MKLFTDFFYYLKIFTKIDFKIKFWHCQSELLELYELEPIHYNSVHHGGLW